jgi:Methyltransferase domain
MLRPTPKMRILNVGASGTSIGLPEQLESFYQYRSQITGGGISFADVQDYRDSFSGVQAVVFDGCALPFADESFDIVYSNAGSSRLPGNVLSGNFDRLPRAFNLNREWYSASG